MYLFVKGVQGSASGLGRVFGGMCFWSLGSLLQCCFFSGLQEFIGVFRACTGEGLTP